MLKKSFFVLLILIFFFLICSFIFSKHILYYQNYTIKQINISSDSINIIGDFGGASGIGQDGFDYSIKNNNIYLKIYQQGYFTSKPLNGQIDITIEGDFTKLQGIYLVQPKGDPIHIWPQTEK